LGVANSTTVCGGLAGAGLVGSLHDQRAGSSRMEARRRMRIRIERESDTRARRQNAKVRQRPEAGKRPASSATGCLRSPRREREAGSDYHMQGLTTAAPRNPERDGLYVARPSPQVRRNC